MIIHPTSLNISGTIIPLFSKLKVIHPHITTPPPLPQLTDSLPGDANIQFTAEERVVSDFDTLGDAFPVDKTYFPTSAISGSLRPAGGRFCLTEKSFVLAAGRWTAWLYIMPLSTTYG
ncbi:hypothetical protein J6590_031893 [Homalodisca vitripennis]|nr:hypothetical protein J6590_031893 [Homalodisca vitripennis]